MNLKYLILEKEQRKESAKTYTYAIERLTDEIKKNDDSSEVVFFKDIVIEFSNSKLNITVNGKNITDFDRILFRGHSLGFPLEYETKRIISDYIDQYNANITSRNILVQNSQAVKYITYYDKIYIYSLCPQFGIEIADTYYRADPTEAMKHNTFNYPKIIKQYIGVNDLRIIDDKEKIKKNVYLLNSVEDFNQENLKDKDLKEYILQEFINTKEDFRVFVAKGNAVAGFSRKATDGFMTVKGGEYSQIEITQEIKEFTEKVAKAFKADFIAVDFMYKNEKPVLIEISLNPGFKAFEQKTNNNQGINLAKIIVETFSE